VQSIPLLGLLIDPTTSTIMSCPTSPFGAGDVGFPVAITGGVGWTVQTVTINSVDTSGNATCSAALGTVGSSGGVGIEYLGPIYYTDLTLLGFGLVLGSSAFLTNPPAIGAQITITSGTGFTPGTYTVVGQEWPAGSGRVQLSSSAGTNGSTGGHGYQPAGTVAACTCTFMDGYFFVSAANSKQVFYSAVNDGTSWSPLDYFSKASYPDQVQSVFADHQEVYVFGDLECTEVFQDTGNTNTTFQPNPGYTMHLGSQARYAVARLGNGVAWLAGDDRRGDRFAVQAVGFSPQRISTPFVEGAWRQYSTVSDAVAFTYAEAGHEFWIVNFPTANATWCYDAMTQQWTERGWWHGTFDSNNFPVFDRQRVAYHCVVDFGTGDAHYGGDWSNGKIYVISSAYLDDAGTAIYRLRRAGHVTTENNRRFYSRWELDCDVAGETAAGIVPRVYWSRLGDGRDRLWMVLSKQTASTGVTVQLFWSDDRGKTWLSKYSQTLPVGVDMQIAAAYMQAIDGTT
jgi:hypothetical protein